MTESERDIEKQLKAYAERRRQEAGAPLDLHPATRRMLQGEVLRRKAKATGEANWFARMLSAYRSRLAVASSVVAVLVVAAVTIVLLKQPEKKEVTLARLNEKDASVKAANEVAVNQPAAASRAESDAVDRQRLDQGTLFDSVRGGNAATVAASETPSLSLGEARKAVTSPELAATPTVADDKAIGGLQRELEALPAAPPTSPPAATMGFALGAVADSKRGVLTLSPAMSPTDQFTSSRLIASDERKDLSKAIATKTPQSAVLAQNFAQVTKQKASGNFAAGGGPQSVLNNFRVEQSGDQLHIIDSDGSTYIGYMELAKAPEVLGKKLGLTPIKADGIAGTTTAKLALKESSDQDFAVPPEMQNYFFRVTGTNQALNQPVVFTGNWIAEPMVAATSGAKAPAQNAQQFKFDANAKQFQNLQWQFQNSRINGQAVVGESLKLDINAVAVPTP